MISFAAALAAVAGCGSSGDLTGSGGHAGGAAPRGGRSGSGGNAGAGASGGSGGSECLASEVPAAPTPPDILVVLEASGSMNDDMTNTACDGGCGALSKWAEVTSGLDSVLVQTERSVNWGLQWFGDAGADGCTVADGPAAPVVPDNAEFIAAALGGRTSANGGVASTGAAPTRLAIQGAANDLLRLTDLNPKLIVLATDGAPGCMAGSDDPAADDSAATIAAIANATTEGFPTYVVGIGNASAATNAILEQMANAGAVPRAGSPAYYPASSMDEMANVLTGIVAAVSSCTFSFGEPPCPGIGESRDNIAVMLDDQFVPWDNLHANGWDYTNAFRTGVQLYGAACDTVRSAPTAHVVTVHYHYLIP
jgi:hypothetical protein